MTNDFILYLLKVMLFHSVCYALYWAVLRKSNYFSLNRAYLLVTLVLGFVAPIFTLPATAFSVEPVISEVNIIAGTFSETETFSVVNTSVQPVTDNVDILNVIYIAGVLILTLRSVLSLRLILRIRARGVEDLRTTPKVITIKEALSFSFINTILLQESASPVVYLHEKGHVLGKHWLDLIFVEIVCIACWMNPMVWLYRKSLKQQHEYLADDYVLHQGVSHEEYLLCILNFLSPQESIGPVHKFNSQSLKQRIAMMTKEKFLPYSKVVYLGIVPLVAFLFLSISGTKDQGGSVDTKKVFVIDAAHGGDDTGSKSPSGILEKEIVLRLATLVQAIGKSKGLNVQLTRTTDQSLSLQERVTVSTEAKADAFLSLHLGFDTKGVQKGAELYVSDENIKYTDSKRMAAVLGEELGAIVEIGNHPVHNSDAFVLNRNQAASAILEVAYLSNEQDVKLISDPSNQRKIAEKIVNALMKY